MSVIIAIVVVCAAVGVLSELLAYRPVRKKGNRMTALITAIGVSLLLQNLAQAIPAIGPNPRVIAQDIFQSGKVDLFGVTTNLTAIFTISIAAVVMVGLQLFHP